MRNRPYQPSREAVAVAVLKAVYKKKTFLIWDFRNISNQFKCDLNVIVLPSVGVVLFNGR